VRGHLAAADSGGAVPAATIAPHAGFIYSGPLAASERAALLFNAFDVCISSFCFR